jgi:hypothetical protein
MNETTAHFLRTVFRLRFRQLMRILREGGLSLWLMLPPVLAVLIFTVAVYTNDSPLKFNVGIAFFIFMIEIGRTDKSFLFLFRRQGLWLRVAEYGAFTLLLSGYALAKNPFNIRYVAIEAVLILIIALWPTGIRRQWILPKARPGKWILGLLPRQLYEVRSGLRPLFLGLLMVWAVTLWAAMHVPVIPFVMPFFVLFFMVPWGLPEPAELTQAQGSFNAVVWKKAGWNALFFLLLFSPHLLLTFLFLPVSLELVVGIGVSIYMCLLLLFFTLLLKYSRPPTAGGMGFGDTLRLVFFGCTIPLIPLCIYLLLKQYRKAQWHLQQYFR